MITWQAKLLKLEDAIVKKNLTKDQSVRPPVLGPVSSWGRECQWSSQKLLLAFKVALRDKWAAAEG